MNILYITHSSGNSGSSKALANIAKGMVSYGHKVFVLTKERGPMSEIIEVIGGKMFYGPVSLTTYPVGGRFLGRIKRFIIKYVGWRKSRKLISQIIDQYNIDLVHTNVGPMNLAYNVCKKKGIPHVWHHREFFDEFSTSSFFPYNSKFYKLINKEGNYNICITQQVLKHCRLNKDEKNQVIYDGVFPESECIKKKKDEKESYFLFVGRIEKNKAPDETIRAFAKFHQQYPEYTLKIAGSYREDSLYFQFCKNLVNKNKIDNYVEFLGVREDVYHLMEYAQAVVVNSRFEGFGFITVEAMLNNSVVIGYNTTGTKEQFDRGLEITGQEIGLRFNNEDELLQCMLYVVKNDTTEMRRRAKEMVINNYTLERCAKEIEFFYKHCCKI